MIIAVQQSGMELQLQRYGHQVAADVKGHTQNIQRRTCTPTSGPPDIDSLLRQTRLNLKQREQAVGLALSWP